MNKRIFLSACMIVKNEEDLLDNCLHSLENIVDEIIIVDTGSTDRTKEICMSYNASIYDFVWTDSFSAARNLGLEKATGEWVLWLDADEELKTDNIDQLKTILKSTSADLCMITLINYFGVPPPDRNRSYLFASYRFFRNYRGIRFTGNVHEHLDILLDTAAYSYAVIPGVHIHHYGYMDAVVKNKDKHNRNLYLLKKEREYAGYSPWIDYHIASEYYRVKNYTEAFNQVNLSIKRFLDINKIPPSLLYKLKYDILISLGSFAGAWPGINNAIALYPEYVDLHFYKGLILYEMRRFNEAISAFQHCIELGDKNPKYLIMTGCGGFRSWFLIGRCHEDTENTSGAIDAYTQAISLYPDYQEAQIRLLLLKQKKLHS